MPVPGLGSTLFPVPSEVQAGMDPQTIAALRRAALLQMGLGMLAARDRGAGLGGGTLFGLNEGQRTLQSGLGQAWMGMRAKREDERLLQQDRRIEAQDARAQADREELRKWRDEQMKFQREESGANQDFRERQLRATNARSAVDDARQAQMLGLSQTNARLQGLGQVAEQKRNHAALLAGQWLSKHKPGDPRWEEMSGLFFTMTGKDWAPHGTSALGGLGSLPVDEGQKTAPPEALEFLQQHPDLKDQFKEKYGYLPY